MKKELKRQLKILRDEHQVHAVVLLLHGGQGDEDEDDDLADIINSWDDTSGIDVILSAHTHLAYSPSS